MGGVGGSFEFRIDCGPMNLIDVGVFIPLVTKLGLAALNLRLERIEAGPPVVAAVIVVFNSDSVLVVTSRLGDTDVDFFCSNRLGDTAKLVNTLGGFPPGRIPLPLDVVCPFI